MTKKLLALLLCVTMLLGMTVTIFAAGEETEEPVEIAVDVFSNRGESSRSAAFAMTTVFTSTPTQSMT